MRRDISKLTLLRCSNCGNELDGLSSDVIFYCAECGRCWISGERFNPISIEFVRMGDPGSILLPFWRVDASVSIRSRHSRKQHSMAAIYGSREFTGRERGLTESDTGSHNDRFIFPAFSTSLVLSTGVRMHNENFLPEKPDDGKQFKIIGGSIGRDDAISLARGVAVGVEVHRADYLASVDLDIEVHSTGIYAIGCTPAEHVFRINDSDIGIPYTAAYEAGAIFNLK